MNWNIGRKIKSSEASITCEEISSSFGKYPFGLLPLTSNPRTFRKIRKIGSANDEAVYCIRLVGAEYPQAHVSAFSMGKTFIEILLNKSKTAMGIIKMINTKIIVKRGEMIVPSVMGEIWMEEMVEAALKAKDTIV